MKNRNIEKRDDWSTPKYLYNKLNDEFHFDFDPCPVNPDFDGLSVEWGMCNFVNPPYSNKLKTAFVQKALIEQKKGKTSVLLLPVSTSTVLFHDFILNNKKEIRFLRGRIKFEGVNTKGEYVKDKVGMFDSMIVVFEGKTPESEKSKEELLSEIEILKEENAKLKSNNVIERLKNNKHG